MRHYLPNGSHVEVLRSSFDKEPNCGGTQNGMEGEWKVVDEENATITGVKIPVINMEDVPKMIEKELPSVEENPILKAIREVRARREAEESDKY